MDQWLLRLKFSAITESKSWLNAEGWFDIDYPLQEMTTTVDCDTLMAADDISKNVCQHPQANCHQNSQQLKESEEQGQYCIQYCEDLLFSEIHSPKVAVKRNSEYSSMVAVPCKRLKIQ
eukprot:GHVH01005236.1.p3 GENE.GHVH01005236.1~~GHVH01005236.1.p3  ORF type:complete len:119 (-),score=21.15 GHVH01005236.1:41-397(-)